MQTDTIDLMTLFDMFENDEMAEAWFIRIRWPDGLRCAFCQGERVNERGNHPTQRFHCYDCMRYFSAKSNSVIHGSNLSYRKWVVALYLFWINNEGLDSYQLTAELGVTQKTAWYMTQRIRVALSQESLELFDGEVEVDESFFGGRARNQPLERRQRLKMIPVIGMVNRDTGLVRAQVIERRTKETLQAFVHEYTLPSAKVYTDEAAGYKGIDREHVSINHKEGEFGPTNSIESFWSGPKRGFKSPYRRFSHKHMQLYIDEYVARHNWKDLPTLEQMASVVRAGAGKRVTFRELAAGDPYPPKPKEEEQSEQQITEPVEDPLIAQFKGFDTLRRAIAGVVIMRWLIQTTDGDQMVIDLSEQDALLTAEKLSQELGETIDVQLPTRIEWSVPE